MTETDMYVCAVQQKAVKAREGEWKPLGKGLFRDDIVTALYLVDNYEFEVDMEESLSTPGLYRLVTPYKNYPMSPATPDTDTYMEVDATDPDHVFFRRYDTGMNWGNGNIIVNSMAGDYYDLGKFNAAIAEGICGTLKEGIITFPTRTLLVLDGTVPSDKGYKIANVNSKFRLKLPGTPDLDVVAAVEGKVDEGDKSFISVNFTIGKDVEKIKIAMFEGEYNQNMADNIVNGSVTSAEMTKSGKHLFPYEKDGVFTFVAVPYYKGNVRTAIYLTKELSYLHEGWKDIGTAFYTEGYLADCTVDMGLEVVTTEVQVQESTEHPRLFRLVDPYGLNYRYSTEQNYDTSHPYYMEIDVADPNRVVIHKMEYGCGLVFNAGTMQLWSRADRYLTEGTKTKEEIEEMNLYGKCNGKVITFPNEALCIKFIDVVDTWYWANLKGSFKLVLPVDVTANISGVDNDLTYPVEYFTLEGVKVGKESLSPGIYIKKQGSKSSKVIIK
ncbi:hypothetical protein [Prevotella sp. OH937_COT-195]|uniref:hypothetical protein n=1 Tax=Prevotella sp. OH937_COT-195 TaxID=2491051 RepID=UPI000F652479|nr:hypothetical protein [Prevotella sp. OH937_COT-195]RRD01957.1 hypothetical protein EII32_05265 [Prevotella sp. OH937_COT-195]